MDSVKLILCKGNVSCDCSGEGSSSGGTNSVAAVNQAKRQAIAAIDTATETAKGKLNTELERALDMLQDTMNTTYEELGSMDSGTVSEQIPGESGYHAYFPISEEIVAGGTYRVTVDGVEHICHVTDYENGWLLVDNETEHLIAKVSGTTAEVVSDEAFSSASIERVHATVVPDSASSAEVVELSSSVTELSGKVDELTSSVETLENGKLDKDMGAAKAGQVLVVGQDGNVTTAVMDGSGSADPAIGTAISGLQNSVSTLNSNKLDKNQGASNAGKLMIVNSTGNVVPDSGVTERLASAENAITALQTSLNALTDGDGVRY